jgi:hypothetical protein
MHKPMNRRALWVFFSPVLIAIALGPAVTSVPSVPRESRMLVSVAPLFDAPAQDVRPAKAAAYDADRVVVFLFGGDSASTDTRMYDGQTWTLHRVPGPPPRTLPATVYDAARKTVVLFGSDRPAPPFTYLGDTRDVDEQR